MVRTPKAEPCACTQRAFLGGAIHALVVFWSAAAHEVHRGKALRAGASAHFLKPADSRL
jgi:hypothetical protein